MTELHFMSRYLLEYNAVKNDVSAEHIPSVLMGQERAKYEASRNEAES
jgi:hypothetical protein